MKFDYCVEMSCAMEPHPVLLNYNSLQLTIASNGYTKVVADKAKIHYLKFTIELLFKGVNGSFTINNLNIIYIN